MFFVLFWIDLKAFCVRFTLKFLRETTQRCNLQGAPQTRRGSLAFAAGFHRLAGELRHEEE